MARAGRIIELQPTIKLTESVVVAVKDLGMGSADQAVIFVEYINVTADSLEMQIKTTSKEVVIPSVPHVAADFFNETMENEDKVNGIGKIINKERQFIRTATGQTARFTMIIPVTEDALRIEFKETFGGGAAGTIRLLGQANPLGV